MFSSTAERSSPRAAVPKLFDIRVWLCGRQLFHGLGRTGVRGWGWFKCFRFIVHFISYILNQLHLRSSGIGSLRLGNPALELLEGEWLCPSLCFRPPELWESTHLLGANNSIPRKLTQCHISIQILLKQTQTNKKSTKTHVGRSVIFYMVTVSSFGKLWSYWSKSLNTYFCFTPLTELLPKE